MNQMANLEPFYCLRCLRQLWSEWPSEGCKYMIVRGCETCDDPYRRYKVDPLTGKMLGFYLAEETAA